MKSTLLKMLLLANTCALTIAFALASERRAYAYVDPGAGLLVLQTVGATFAGVLLAFRRKLTGLLHRGTKQEASLANPEAGLPGK
jgi:hypothetical protein